MKKIVSVIIATMMAISMFAVSVPAMAENVSSPAAVTIADGKVKTTVNGKERQGVTYKINVSKPNEVTFTYNGKGTLKSWSDNLSSLGLVEGTDYTITVNKDGSETISFISRKAVTAWNNGSVVVNAVVDFDEATTKASKASKEKYFFKITCNRCIKCSFGRRCSSSRCRHCSFGSYEEKRKRLIKP